MFSMIQSRLGAQSEDSKVYPGQPDSTTAISKALLSNINNSTKKIPTKTVKLVGGKTVESTEIALNESEPRASKEVQTIMLDAQDLFFKTLPYFKTFMDQFWHKEKKYPGYTVNVAKIQSFFIDIELKEIPVVIYPLGEHADKQIISHETLSFKGQANKTLMEQDPNSDEPLYMASNNVNWIDIDGQMEYETKGVGIYLKGFTVSETTFKNLKSLKLPIKISGVIHVKYVALDTNSPSSCVSAMV